MSQGAEVAVHLPKMKARKVARSRKTSGWDLMHKRVRERALSYAIWVDEWADDTAHAAWEGPTSDARNTVIALATRLAVDIATTLDARLSLGAASAESFRARSAALALEHSVRAWEQLVAAREVPNELGEVCIAELRWLQAQLEGG